MTATLRRFIVFLALLAPAAIAAASLRTAAPGKTTGAERETAVSPQDTPAAPQRVRPSVEGQGPRIQRQRLATGPARVGQRVEIALDVASTATRPYYPHNPTDDGYGHPDGITVEATVEEPGGAVYVIPAFHHVPYRVTPQTRAEEAIGVAGPPDWRVRFTPRAAGRHVVRCRVADRDGDTEGDALAVDVAAAPARGFVRINGADPRFLVYDNGDDFLPIGEGRQWAPDPRRPTWSYVEAFERDAAAGVTLTRVWDQNDGYNLSIEGSDAAWQPRWSQFSKALGMAVSGARTGRRAARFSAAEPATEGYLQWVAVAPDTEYTLQAFVRTERLAGGGAVVALGAESIEQPGGVQSAPVAGTTPWQAVTVSIRTAPGTEALAVWAGAVGSTGSAWFDDLRLTAAGTDHNVLSDPGFERHFPRSDRGNDPEDPRVNQTVPKGTFVNQWAAFRLDRIIEAAEREGIAVEVCLHGDVYWTWDATVYDDAYARENGYVVPWHDPRHVGYWKRTLRYRVARWGHSPAVLAWELWNEHGHVPVTGSEADTEVYRFYRTMASFLEALDPFDHLITTSQGSQAYSPEFFVGAGLGLVNYHDYITTTLPRHPQEWTDDARLFMVGNARDLVARWPEGAPRRPFIWGEVGTLLGWNEDDPLATTGAGGAITRHHFVWAGLFSPVFTGPIDWQAAPKAASTSAAAAFFAGERYATSGWAWLSTGEYGGTGLRTSDARLRALGLHAAAGDRVLAWVHHRDHSWAKVVREGLAPAPVEGTVVAAGLGAGTWLVEWWDTQTGRALARSEVEHPGGDLALTLPAPLSTDIAVKVTRR